MIKLAITGSIGMGKTTTALLFAEEGIPVFDADKAVHQLYGKNGEAVAAIAGKFGGVIKNEQVNRAALSHLLATNPDDFTTLEDIVHPLVTKKREAWAKKHQKADTEMVLFDIPLLFEGKKENLVDFVILATAPKEVQMARVLARANMDKQKFEQILSRQMPDAQKRKKADYIITTNYGISDARLQVRAILRHIRNK